MALFLVSNLYALLVICNREIASGCNPCIYFNVLKYVGQLLYSSVIVSPIKERVPPPNKCILLR